MGLGGGLRVAVIGLGTAGGAAALFLGRQGHRVTVFEKTSRATVAGSAAGAGIGLQPIGLRCLQRLGLVEPVLELGARVDHLHATTPSGKKVIDLSYADLEPSLFGVGLHRSVLFHELDAAVAAQTEVEVHMGTGVASVRAARGASRQSDVELESGERLGPFDLVVVCDGRSSAVRRDLVERGHVSAWERWYRFGCLWAVLPDRCGYLEGANQTNVLLQRLDSAKHMLGFLPTGRSHPACGPAREKSPLVSLFWSVDMRSLDEELGRGLDAWKAQVLRLEPRAEGLLEGITSLDDLIPATYSDVIMPQLHYGASCVFLGDAAHSTSPQLGQGSNLALVDAWTLSESLARGLDAKGAAAGADDVVAGALEHYTAERRWRLRFYQLNSMLLTPVFQSHSRAVGALRDACMGRMCRFPPTRWQMLAVMTGAQRNGVPGQLIDPDEYLLANK